MNLTLLKKIKSSFVWYRNFSLRHAIFANRAMV